jgi:hypothetical protein
MLAGWIACALVAAPATRAETIFTESFETPLVTGSQAAGNLFPGAVTLDNPAVAGGTPNVSGFVARVVDGNSAGLDVAATDGEQAVIYGFGGAIGTSLTWQVAPANTLVNGSTLTITYDVASLFAPATAETWNVIFSGGANATFSASLSAADTVDVWRQDQFQTTVTDSSQPVTLRIVATRASSASDDFAIDNIVIDGTFVTGEPLALADPLVDEFSITEKSADASVILSNGPADVSLFWATSDYGLNLLDWQTNGTSSALGNQADGIVAGSLGGLAPDTIYTTRFYAVNTVPDPDEEAWSAPVTFSTQFGADKKVTDLSATAVAYNQIELTWTDSFNTEEEYYLEFSDDGGASFLPLATLPPDSTGFTHSGLNESTAYQYRILAFSLASGDSAWSDVADATTPARPPFTTTVHSDFDFEDNLIPAVFETIPYGSGPATGGGVLSFDGTTAIQADTATVYGGSAPVDNFIYEVIVTHSALDGFDIPAGIVDAGGTNSGSFLYQGGGTHYLLQESGEGGASGTTVPVIGTTVALAFVMDNGIARLFVNGSEEASRPFTAGGATPIDTATLEAVVLGGNLFDNGANPGGGTAMGAFNGSIHRARFSTFTSGPFDPSFLLTVSPAGDFAAWIDGFSVTDKSFNGDDDGDGLANGLENFLGTDPGAWNAGITAVTFDGTIMNFQHPQNENPASDVNGSYEWSPDLVTWYAGDGIDGPAGVPTVNIPAVVPVGGTATVTATASESLQRLFVRAKATLNP